MIRSIADERFETSPKAGVDYGRAFTPTRVRENIYDVGKNTRELMLGQASCPSLIPYGISLVGTSEAVLGFRFERISPSFVQILACVGGEGEVLIDNEWRRCRPGQAYITPQRMPHSYRAVRRSVWRLVWMMYDESHVTIEEPPTLKTVDAALLETTFVGLYREQNSLAEHAVLASWSHVLDTTARRMLARQIHDPRLNELWELIASDLSRPWTLEEMADVANLSSEHLRRLCHATLHRSPMRHLTYLRMRYAAELLALSNEKIEVIGRRVGYDNQFAFSTAFKREIGLSPSSCRGTRNR